MASETDELRILLWGRTGAGKSVSGNTILGKNEFQTDSSSASTTMECQVARGNRDGKDLVVVDTPGLMNTEKSEDEVMKDFLSSIKMVFSGPHVILYVLNPTAFTERDKKILEAFKDVFEGVLKHTIFLFTHGDDRYDIKKLIGEKYPPLRFILKNERQYHVFINETKNQDDSQVDGLLKKITDLVEENQGEHYSNEGFKKAADAFGKKMPPTSATKPPPSIWDRGFDMFTIIAPELPEMAKTLQEIAQKFM